MVVRAQQQRFFHAHIERTQVFKSIHHGFAGRIARNASQCFKQDSGGNITFQRNKAGNRGWIIGGQCFSEIRHNRQVRFKMGHYLGDDDAVAVSAQIGRQRSGAHKRYVQKKWIQLVGLCQADEFRTGSIGADHDNGFAEVRPE